MPILSSLLDFVRALADPFIIISLESYCTTSLRNNVSVMNVFDNEDQGLVSWRVIKTS